MLKDIDEKLSKKKRENYKKTELNIQNAKGMTMSRGSALPLLKAKRRAKYAKHEM